MAFEREDALRSAESAEGAVRWHVGGDGAAANADVGAVIGACGVDGATGEDDRRKSFVGAAVDGEVDLHGEESAVAGDGGFVMGARGVALGCGDHVFGAVVDHFYGLAGLPG